MTGPATAPGPDLACRDFLTACAALGGAGNRARALRPALSIPAFESAESLSVLEALRRTFIPGDPGPSPAWPCAFEEILRSPAARAALGLFADVGRFGTPCPEAEAVERGNLAGFADNTPDRIARILDKKRALERKALAAFRRKHGGARARTFAEMDAGGRREYLWMWAQSAYLAKRRFARAAEAWARAAVM